MISMDNDLCSSTREFMVTCVAPRKQAKTRDRGGNHDVGRPNLDHRVESKDSHSSAAWSASTGTEGQVLSGTCESISFDLVRSRDESLDVARRISPSQRLVCSRATEKCPLGDP